MKSNAKPNSLDRRRLLEAGAIATAALTTVQWPGFALAQETRAAAAGAAAKTLSERLADLIVGFDLKRVLPEVIDRARVAFIDTLGVMLAGSREDVARLACDMVRAEGAAPAATVVGQSLRTSPQLAALAT
jgi:hypothetical protein